MSGQQSRFAPDMTADLPVFPTILPLQLFPLTDSTKELLKVFPNLATFDRQIGVKK
jgi:hypothetical protein